ncbi:hypothetical protein HDE_04308 [Halotydeus destructor]|nr:hypothetical protein HDE_04308 [Halotydeus destructor]
MPIKFQWRIREPYVVKDDKNGGLDVAVSSGKVKTRRMVRDVTRGQLTRNPEPVFTGSKPFQFTRTVTIKPFLFSLFTSPSPNQFNNQSQHPSPKAVPRVNRSQTSPVTTTPRPSPVTELSENEISNQEDEPYPAEVSTESSLESLPVEEDAVDQEPDVETNEADDIRPVRHRRARDNGMPEWAKKVRQQLKGSEGRRIEVSKVYRSYEDDEEDVPFKGNDKAKKYWEDYEEKSNKFKETEKKVDRNEKRGDKLKRKQLTTPVPERHRNKVMVTQRRAKAPSNDCKSESKRSKKDKVKTTKKPKKTSTTTESMPDYSYDTYETTPTTDYQDSAAEEYATVKPEKEESKRIKSRKSKGKKKDFFDGQDIHSGYKGKEWADGDKYKDKGAHVTTKAGGYEKDWEWKKGDKKGKKGAGKGWTEYDYDEPGHDSGHAHYDEADYPDHDGGYRHKAASGKQKKRKMRRKQYDDFAELDSDDDDW